MQLAASFGFEPKKSESKSLVLPLHHEATNWSVVLDLNQRSSAPKADALSGYANDRLCIYYTYSNRYQLKWLPEKGSNLRQGD